MPAHILKLSIVEKVLVQEFISQIICLVSFLTLEILDL